MASDGAGFYPSACAQADGEGGVFQRRPGGFGRRHSGNALELQNDAAPRRRGCNMVVKGLQRFQGREFRNGWE